MLSGTVQPYMRTSVIYSVLLVGIASWGFSADPQRVRTRIDSMLRVADDFVRRKDIEVSGNDLLEKSAIVSLLPLEKNNLWWRLHRPEIVAGLLTSPLIKSADLAPCARLSFRCFKVKVSEREPAFITLDSVGKDLWVVGEDGKLITKVPSSKRKGRTEQEVAQDLGALVILEGAFRNGLSPDMIQQRLEALARISGLLSGSTKLNLSLLRVTDADEVEASFLDLRGTVLLGDLSSGLSYFEERSTRLNALLSEMGMDRLAQARFIDLSYQKLGVVRVAE